MSNFVANISKRSEHFFRGWLFYQRVGYISLGYVIPSTVHFHFEMQDSEAIPKMCSVKNVFLEISQNSQENACARVSFLIKLQAIGLRTATLLKKRLWLSCFPVNSAKFLRTPFLTEHRWLLLKI